MEDMEERAIGEVLAQHDQVGWAVDTAQHGMNVGVREDAQAGELLPKLPRDARRDVVLPQHLGHDLCSLPHTLPHLVIDRVTEYLLTDVQCRFSNSCKVL